MDSCRTRSCCTLVSSGVACLMFLAGCATARSTVIELSPRVELPDKSAVIFFVDGMAAGRLHKMLAAGELPNIAEHFARGGVEVSHAIVSIPAITYPNSVSLLTGCFPGRHGILGNVWFDRATLEIKDYAHADSYRSCNGDFDRPTIYELLSDQLTVNVQCHTRRGATEVIDNVMATGVDWFSHNFSGVDDRVGYCVADVARLADKYGRWPSVTMYYFPAVDEIGHRFGSNSSEYAEALKVADRSIGRVCEAIKATELGERTYFVLVTDHGHVDTPVSRIFDTQRWLKKVAGLNVHRGRLDGGSYDQRLRKLKSIDAVLIADAGRRGVIHLKGRGGWLSQAPPEEVQFLLPRLALHPAIDLTVSRDGPGRIKVISKKGLAVIQRSVEGSVALYELTLKRGDPFGYTKTADLKRFVEGGWHDSRSWLAATADSSYPDFVPQIAEMFDSTRAGDIVLFAADGWGFDAESKSSHGSCLREDMSVPMFFAGPGLPAGGRIDCARLVDVMPTILDLLGQSHRLARVEPIDGVSIAAVLKGAERPDEREHDTFSDKSDVLSDVAHQSAAVRDRRMEPVESD